MGRIEVGRQLLLDANIFAIIILRLAKVCRDKKSSNKAADIVFNILHHFFCPDLSVA
jgi:hypothetical protein